MSASGLVEEKEKKQIQFKWQPGIKKNVAFSNLEILEKYEPQTVSLFKEITDGENAEDKDYKYRLKHSARFGYSVTRWEKPVTKTAVGYGSRSITIEKRPPIEHSSGAAEYNKRISHNITRTQQIADEINILKSIRQQADALITTLQQEIVEEYTS